MDKNETSPATIGERVKNIFFAVFLFLIIVATFSFLALFYQYQFKQWVVKLNGYDIVENPSYKEMHFQKLNAQESFLLGWTKSANKPKHIYSVRNTTTSYHDIPEKNKSGKIRIGLFGCSFVEGSEVDPGLDFPTLLQKKLKENGLTNIEVINFGVGSYGMHQSYLLFEFIGKKYDLDYIVLLPITVYIERDATFKFDNTYYPLHARLILKNNDIELLEPEGASRLDAARIYHSILQPLKYIRYDFRMPNFLKMFTPIKWRERRNPFYYYSGKPKNEILKTYELIIHRIAELKKPVAIISVTDEILLLPKKIQRKNVSSHKDHYYDLIDPMRADSIYFAPGGHLSGTGNQVRADIIYSIITGVNSKIPMISITSHTQTDPSAIPTINEKLGLHEYDSVALSFGSANFSTFVTIDDGANGSNQFSPVNIKTDGIRSLIFTPHVNPNILYLFQKSPIESDNQEILLSYQEGGRHINLPIGGIKKISPAIGMMYFNRHNNSTLKPNYIIKHFTNNELVLHVNFKAAKPRLIFGNTSVVVASSSQQKSESTEYPMEMVFKIGPSKTNQIGTLRSHKNEFFNPHTQKRRKGSIDIALKHNHKNTYIPLGKWEIIDKEIPKQTGFLLK